MATEVKIPTLGESISSGILAAWHVQSGDYVESGQTLYDLETDKITQEGTAETSGVIELKVSEGDEVEIGAVVAVIDESASKSDSGSAGNKEEKQEEKQESAGSGQQEDSEKKKDSGQDKREEEKAREKEKDSEEGEAAAEQLHPPAVRRLAEESGIDPDKVEGSGKGGRVTKGDMLEAIDSQKKGDRQEKKESGSGEEKRSTGESSSKGSGERSTRKKMTPLRKTIARRLVEAQQTTAMLTTFNEVDMSTVMQFRKTHQDAFTKKHGVKLGFMSFFTKAAVHALKQVPNVNGRIEGDEIIINHYYDIGVAVSTPKGLMVPVVRDCDEKSFAGIEKDILAYADKAKQGKITIEDLQGGVFTISNGGIFGSMLSTPILNTPQSAILGMHTIQERAVVVNGEITIRPMMYLALSYDHRLVDGREAVGFLVAIKQAIEDPARILFEI